ncbi:hypothetical protein [Desulfosarcina widdelii]|uniref:hypothetical protein n=1 Tax=Desulfosarcina widdelii TaxID=947919 RepID=UPI0012D3668D|nr:hypothetical protein [Desulfosarcina widdelii]
MGMAPFLLSYLMDWFLEHWRQEEVHPYFPTVVQSHRKRQEGGNMIQSPCRNCPNRYKDKRHCMESCVLLHRVQMFQAGRQEQSIYTAVNSADDNRYRLMTAREIRRSVMGSPGLY